MTFKALSVLLMIGLSSCSTQKSKEGLEVKSPVEDRFSVEKKSIYALCNACEKRTKKVLNIDDELKDIDVPKVQAIVNEMPVVKELKQSELSIKKFVMHFDFDKSKANKEQIVALGNFLDATVSQDKTIQITVLGNADPRGKLEYNKILSKKRADYVVSLLVKAGIERQRITTAIEVPCCEGSKKDKEDVQYERRRATVIIEVR